MKKIFLTIAFIATGLVASAQVGIGNTDPKVSLHVTGTNDNGAVTGVDGVLVPRVNNANMATATAGTEDGQLVYNTVSKAFFYWNAATPAWTQVGGASAPARYENIRGNVSTFNTATYTVQATDYIVISTYAGGVPVVTFPALTDTAADRGRLIFYFNDQPASGTTFVGVEFAGTATNPDRGRTFVWSGTKWIGIGL